MIAAVRQEISAPNTSSRPTVAPAWIRVRRAGRRPGDQPAHVALPADAGDREGDHQVDDDQADQPAHVEVEPLGPHQGRAEESEDRTGGAGGRGVER